MSTTEILNKIDDMCGESLLDKMIDFCETYDINPQFLGDILEEDSKFKEMLHNDCVCHNSIEDDALTRKTEIMQDLDVW